MIIIKFFIFCIVLIVVSNIITNRIDKYLYRLSKKFKVDYYNDPECPENLYAIYSRKYFWNKWGFFKSYSSLEEAVKSAKKLNKVMKDYDLPNYF
jgi:hypothetical protein